MKQPAEKRDRFSLVILIIVALLFAASVIFIFLSEDEAQKGRNAFNALQCLWMLLCMGVPYFIRRRFMVQIPRLMQVIYVVFCFAGIMLGDFFNFFDKVPHWDSYLHTMSGVLLGALGFILVNTLNHVKSASVRLSPLFVCAAAVSFAVTVGTVWELIEYSIDGLFGSNMQQFLATSGGTLVQAGDVPLEGHAALTDTMKDLALDLAGSLVISVVGYFELRHEKKGIANMELEPVSDKRP